MGPDGRAAVYPPRALEWKAFGCRGRASGHPSNGQGLSRRRGSPAASAGWIGAWADAQRTVHPDAKCVQRPPYLFSTTALDNRRGGRYVGRITSRPSGEALRSGSHVERGTCRWVRAPYPAVPATPVSDCSPPPLLGDAGRGRTGPGASVHESPRSAPGGRRGRRDLLRPVPTYLPPHTTEEGIR